jgi:site-specific DNA-cytosine methylase
MSLRGGYPCQPFQYGWQADYGDRRSESHLWPYGLEKPLANYDPNTRSMENVRGHLSLWRIRPSALENLPPVGYDAEWRVISAASEWEPITRRDRIVIVAYPTGQLFSNGGN